MSVQTTAGGGPNPAAAGGPSADGQSGPGASQRVNGDAASGAAVIPDGRTASNLTTGGSSPQNGGLAKVFAGRPEAGSERVNGDAQSGAAVIPDQAGIKPKGNSETNQSNDSSNLPAWVQQLPKRLTEKLSADPNSINKLSAFKNVEDLLTAYLGASTQPEGKNAIPGKDSAPEAVQAFYEQLGKPQNAEGYSFAKSDPALAQFAFNANLSAGQADALYRAGMAQMDDARKAVQTVLAQDFQATEAMLQSEYGDRFDEAMALLGRGLGNNPKTGEMSPLAQSLASAGLAGKPEIVHAFIELGRATSEGTAAGGSYRSQQPESVTQGRGFSYKDDYARN